MDLGVGVEVGDDLEKVRFCFGTDLGGKGNSFVRVFSFLFFCRVLSRSRPSPGRLKKTREGEQFAESANSFSRYRTPAYPPKAQSVKETKKTSFSQQRRGAHSPLPHLSLSLSLSLPNASRTLSSSSCETSSGRYDANDSIPTSSQALTLDRTYVSESPRAPTSTTARPGAFPVAATSSFTPAAISPRMVAAMALPSMMEADWEEEGASAGKKVFEGRGKGGKLINRQSAKRTSLFPF